MIVLWKCLVRYGPKYTNLLDLPFSTDISNNLMYSFMMQFLCIFVDYLLYCNKKLTAFNNDSRIIIFIISLLFFFIYLHQNFIFTLLFANEHS